MAEKLKANQLAKLETGEHYDGGGLILRVQDSGSRSWILRTVVCGKRREIGLGGFSTVSLAEARDKAAELRRRARKGEDIVTERRQEREAAERATSMPTFETAAREYHATLKPTFESETHA